tara:strand:- start:1181 stop:1402 length:222 start_codon:yes stop_codon:yes gene_type:complete
MPNSTIEMSESALTVITEAYQEERTKNLDLCLIRYLNMGGHVYKESDTMLILNSTSGMTVGMHWDGKEWSLHS